MGIHIATAWVRQTWTVSFLKYSRIASSGHLDHVGCETIDRYPFNACLHAWHYITESCWNSLNDSEKAQARSRCGIVKDSGWAKPYKKGEYTYYTFDPTAIVECFNDTCYARRPDLAPDPCDGVVCEPECVGVDLHETVCEDGECVRGALKEANNITTCGYVKPVCDEGDKRPGEICRGGDWVEHTPEEPVPGEGRLYVKFAIPYLDRLPWLPYEPWMWILPGFEVVEVTQG